MTCALVDISNLRMFEHVKAKSPWASASSTSLAIALRRLTVRVRIVLIEAELLFLLRAASTTLTALSNTVLTLDPDRAEHGMTHAAESSPVKSQLVSDQPDAAPAAPATSR